MAIEDVESLRRHLQWAMSVELSLVPVYLYAMYSIVDEQSEPYKLIRSVVAEEMLHGVLDANMLVAIGGDPLFYDRTNLPDYPVAIPHHRPPLVLQLAPISPEVLDLLVTIEKPKAIGAIPEDDDYETQGQFYMAIEEAFDRLDDGRLFADPRPERQMASPTYYQPVEFDADDSGGLHAVVDAGSVRKAIETVIHQGEGLHDDLWADPEHRELTHYHKFLQIAEGESPVGDLWPVPANPKAVDCPEPLRRVVDLFNASYAYLLITLDEIYRPLDDASRDLLVQRLYRLMTGVLSPLARFLVSRPVGDGRHGAPTFEMYEFADPAGAREELLALADTTVGAFPDLEGVVKQIYQP